MRIVASPDGSVNNIDRAIWMTFPFDLSMRDIDVTDVTSRLRSPFSIGQAVGTVTAIGSPTSWSIISEAEA